MAYGKGTSVPPNITSTPTVFTDVDAAIDYYVRPLPNDTAPFSVGSYEKPEYVNSHRGIDWRLGELHLSLRSWTYASPGCAASQQCALILTRGGEAEVIRWTVGYERLDAPFEALPDTIKAAVRAAIAFVADGFADAQRQRQAKADAAKAAAEADRQARLERLTTGIEG